MPIQQFFIDPNTGATLSASYIRVVSEDWDRSSNRVSLNVGRWAAAMNYSQGQAPHQQRDISIAGPGFTSQFLPTLAAAEASFKAAFVGAAEAFILAQPQFSGAIQIP